MRQVAIVRVLLFTCVVSITASAQDQFTRVVGAEDSQIALPIEMSPAGQKSSQALQEILSFAQVAHLNGFQDMRADGQAILPGDVGSAPATLFVRNGNQVRLNISTPSGARIICGDGVGFSVRHENKARFSFPAGSAMLSGFFFASALSIDFSQAGLSVVDRGLTTLDDSGTLHRISVQIPVSEPKADGSLKIAYLPVDFYFDPNTHLLSKAAALVTLGDDSTQKYLRVTTFGDYRQVNGLLVPFHYYETLNGQREWTLQLNQVNVNLGLPASTFHLDRELADEN